MWCSGAALPLSPMMPSSIHSPTSLVKSCKRRPMQTESRNWKTCWRRSIKMTEEQTTLRKPVAVIFMLLRQQVFQFLDAVCIGLLLQDFTSEVGEWIDDGIIG